MPEMDSDTSSTAQSSKAGDIKPTEGMEIQRSDKSAENKPSTSSHLQMKIFNCAISINRPLIPLKLALFCWYGAGSIMPSFLTVLFRQRGVTLSELSAMTIFAPLVQVLGTTISGIVADKLGRSKPVLVANILLVTSVVIGILLLPKLDHTVCEPPQINVSCHPEDLNKLVARTSCNYVEGVKLKNCKILCSGNSTEVCDGQNRACRGFARNEEEGNVSLSLYKNTSSYLNQTEDNCLYDVNTISHKRLNISLCNKAYNINCTVFCTVDSDSTCSLDNGFSNLFLIAYAVLYVLYLTTYSNSYRCFDIMVMTLVKEYDSDFGHERFFSILGNLVTSPVAGIIADATTSDGEERNYAAAIYLFLGMNCLLLVIISKLPVVVNTPGEKLWKKSFKLLKNLDVLMFSIIILVLGTSWNFVKYFTFWFLAELNAPSVLLGLIPSVSALYGLPILLTSKWWVKKLGTHQIFILSLLGYVVCSTGYSFLSNPWYSLLLELHGSITYYLLWVAVVEHSHSISPEGLTSTVIAIAGAIHYSAGKTTSGLTGGMVMNQFGAAVAFRLNAIICLSFAVLYTIFFYFRRKYSTKKHQLDQKGVSKEESKKSVIFTLQYKT